MYTHTYTYTVYLFIFSISLRSFCNSVTSPRWAFRKPWGGCDNQVEVLFQRNPRAPGEEDVRGKDASSKTSSKETMRHVQRSTYLIPPWEDSRPDSARGQGRAGEGSCLGVTFKLHFEVAARKQTCGRRRSEPGRWPVRQDSGKVRKESGSWDDSARLAARVQQREDRELPAADGDKPLETGQQESDVVGYGNQKVCTEVCF